MDPRDHAESARAQALIAGEKQVQEMIDSGATLSSVLDTLCRVGEEALAASRCQVLVVDPSGKRFERAVAPSLPASLVEKEIGLVVRPASGPCGWACAMRTQVIVSDIAKERRWPTDRWPAWSLELGFLACVSTPIFSSAQKVLGSFGVYRLEQGSAATPELVRIERLARLASIALERAQPDAGVT